MAEKHESKEVHNRNKEANKSRILYYTQPKDDGPKTLISLFPKAIYFY
jgi:hypothetical protein